MLQRGELGLGDTLSDKADDGEVTYAPSYAPPGRQKHSFVLGRLQQQRTQGSAGGGVTGGSNGGGTVASSGSQGSVETRGASSEAARSSAPAKGSERST